jgi:hypothetical protein
MTDFTGVNEIPIAHNLLLNVTFYLRLSESVIGVTHFYYLRQKVGNLRAKNSPSLIKKILR